MQIEPELKKYFLQQFPEENQTFTELSEHFWIDLTSQVNGYFSTEQSKQIIDLLCQRLKQGEKWTDIVRDFTRNQNWGFKPSKQRPPKILTAEQKNSKQLFKYIWAFFQSMIVLKIAVYYFGLNGADNPDRTHPAWVWVFFGISTFSLFLFAYRNRNDDRTEDK